MDGSDPSTMTAEALAQAFRTGTTSAGATVAAVLARIARVDGAVNAFTDVLPERARAGRP
jgi:1-carboxybiuret hydrolase